MEGNLSQGNLVSGGVPFQGINLQGSMRVHNQTQYPPGLNQQLHPVHRQGSLVHASVCEGFPHYNLNKDISLTGYSKGDKGKDSVSDEDEPSYVEDGADCHNESGRGKKGSAWQRVKWTDEMVKVLITAVSYIGEDISLDCDGGMRRKYAVLQKKGKWKLVSKVMAERGFHVSPQQCEDKFNDLNKRYKRLNDMIGRGTSCQVVENPQLLDVIDYLTDKEKDDVRKILSSKHLFYEEMCSYHNGNRLHLPHDLALQRSLQLALRSEDEHDNDDTGRNQHDLEEDGQEIDDEHHNKFEENQTSRGGSRGIYVTSGASVKRLKHCQSHVDSCLLMQVPQVDKNQMSSESAKTPWLQKQWIASRTLQLEEQKLQIQLEMFELEKQRFKWQKFISKKDHELEKMRVENERMKLENERMSLKLKRKEMAMGST